MDAIREMLAERVGELEAEMRSHKAAMEGMQAERDGLAAHVERLHCAVLRPFTQCCTYEDALRDAQRIVLNGSHATSLTKIKAQWQAEAVTDYAHRHLGGTEQELAEIYASKLRHQAEEGEA